MSNITTFKNEMQKLGNEVKSEVVAEFYDSNKSSSTFYTKLVDLFKKLPNDPATKGCKYTFLKTSTDSTSQNFYLKIDGDKNKCLNPIPKTESIKNTNIVFYPDTNTLAFKRPGGSSSPTSTDYSGLSPEEQEKQISKGFYTGVIDTLTGGQDLSQNKISRDDLLGTTNESLENNINRIKKLING